MSLELEEVALADLKPHPKNYRSHPADQIAHLARSIKKHGVYKNIVTARELTILAGHGVAEAAAEAGRTTVPINRKDLDPDEPDAIEILAYDNLFELMAEDDDAAIAELLASIEDETAAVLLAKIQDDGLPFEEPDPPDEFPEVDESIQVDHQCPKCGYKWSGSTKPIE